MIVNTDIDIDVANRNGLLSLIKNVPAMIKRDGKHIKHNTGVYFHNIPSDPFTGISTVDYQDAEQEGYFKIDVLNVSIYKHIKDKAQLDELLEMEPMWELLEHQEVVSQLFHVHNHYETVKTMKPQSIEQPCGTWTTSAKRHPIGKDWDTVFGHVWQRPDDDSYYFKRHMLTY